MLVLGACNPSSDGMPSSTEGEDAGDSTSVEQRARRDAAPTPIDAAPTPTDAGVADGGGQIGSTGVVSCYLEAAPSTTCTLPTHCCFTNYSSQHNGECSTSTCTWGTITCDGPEDCASGQHCCAHANVDPDYGITGYTLACQASACGAAPLNQELCHPTTTSAAGTCSSGTGCVSALNYDYDLPRSLYICR
ncbi:MAG TPA: hypothetical protein VHN14_11505 [Kofleriaceae bacterium]|jgi:hypothetical protein|nr:hypothetical protein [Kofleriaceae bacterium]